MFFRHLSCPTRIKIINLLKKTHNLKGSSGQRGHINLWSVSCIEAIHRNLSSQPNQRVSGGQPDDITLSSQSYDRNHSGYSQKDYRDNYIANQNDYRDFSSKPDHNDFLNELDNASRRISPRISRHFHQLLVSNPKYSDTIHRPSCTITEKDIEETKEYISELCKSGEIQKAMDAALKSIQRDSMFKQEILFHVEKCLTCRELDLSHRNAMDAIEAFVQMDYQPRYLLKSLSGQGEEKAKFFKNLARPRKSRIPVHVGSIFSAKFTADSDIAMKQVNTDIKMMFEKGEIRKAMGLATDAILRDLGAKEDILVPLEKQLTRQVQSLSITDALYALDTFIHFDLYQAKGFLKALLDHLVTHFDATEKTSSNIVHLLYFIGLSRQAPTELMRSIETYVRENIKDYNTQDICLICFAFFVANYTMQNSSLIQAMAYTVLEEFRDYVKNAAQNNFELHLLGNILKAFRHAGYNDVRFYIELGDLICDYDMKSAPTAPMWLQADPFLQIPHTYAVLRIKHEKLFQKMEECIDNLKHNGFKLRSKDLTRLCWSYAMLEGTAPGHWQEALILELDRLERLTSIRLV